jgi:hypothetical protein
MDGVFFIYAVRKKVKTVLAQVSEDSRGTGTQEKLEAKEYLSKTLYRFT